MDIKLTLSCNIAYWSVELKMSEKSLILALIPSSNFIS